MHFGQGMTNKARGDKLLITPGFIDEISYLSPLVLLMR